MVNGSGSFGHSAAAKYKTQAGIINKNSIKGFPLVADAAVQINRIVITEFFKLGLPVVSFSPLSFITSSGRKLDKVFSDPIKKALDLGLIPVIYGDVIMDEKSGFCIYSGEKSISILADKFKEDYTKIRIIFCGDTDGVLDRDGNTVEMIDRKVFNKLMQNIKGSSATDVTGGMLHKVEESLILANRGIKSLIVNGKKEKELQKAISGKNYKGTLIK